MTSDDRTALISQALKDRADQLRSLAHSTQMPAGLAGTNPDLADLVARGRARLIADAEALEQISEAAFDDWTRLRDPWVAAALRAHAHDLRARAATAAASLPGPGNVWWATGPALAGLVERGRQAMECEARAIEAAADMVGADESAEG